MQVSVQVVPNIREGWSAGSQHGPDHGSKALVCKTDFGFQRLLIILKEGDIMELSNPTSLVPTILCLLSAPTLKQVQSLFRIIS